MVSLKLSKGFSSSQQNFPMDAIKVLNSLEEFDLSNNYVKNLPDTAFHFLKKLRKLELQDNMIEIVHKGTFQVNKTKNSAFTLLNSHEIL